MDRLDIFKGVSWMSGLQLSVRIFTIIKTAVLARVLSPFEFGIFGIASLVLTFYELLTETGVNIFLIQSKKDIKGYINSAWVVSIIRGVIVSLLMIVSAGLISSFFQSPESFSILLFLSFVPFVRGFINPSAVKFQKELKFNLEFSYKTFLFFADAFIAVTVALFTHSAFSLAWGMLGAAIIEVFISLIFIKPRPVFSIDGKYLSEIFHKGKWVTLYGILDYFGKQGDNIAVGKILGTQSLGVYQVAYRISTLTFTEITEVINKVFFPLYSRISDDKKRMKSIFVKSFIALFSVVVPLGLVVFLFADIIVMLLLGDKWGAAVPILRVLSLYGVIRALVSYPNSLFLALNHQKFVAITSLLRATALGVTIIPFVYYFGIVGAAYSAIFSVLVEIPAVSYFIFSIFRKK